MTDELEQRIAELEAKSWTLVHHREPRVQLIDGALVHERGSFRFERMWRGSTVSEIGETLEQCVEATLWQQERIEQLDDDKTTPVLSGLISQEGMKR